MNKLNLLENWQFKARSQDKELRVDFAGTEGWLPASVPGTVHQDLMAAGQIPDPFYGLNEHEVQWVGETDWLYRCRFDLADNFNPADSSWLNFEGLDTYATVWLNGQQILVNDNMFVPRQVEVTGQLQPTGNRLEILFESAVRRGRELEAKYGPGIAWNGNGYRVYVRKAQYHFGWDWGPVLVTAGLWRGVSLENSPARLANLECPVELNDEYTWVTITTRAIIETSRADNFTVRFHLRGPDGDTLATTEVPLVQAKAEHTFTINQPELWWPQGYGARPLYRLEVTLLENGVEIDRQERRLGLRRLRLVQEPVEGEEGTSFLFEVNGTPIFCGGANWIPADSFTPRVSAERYRHLLELAASGNMVMLRVWGGGIYEEDIFYDLCDEMGLLVWQDFMFACGIYPATDWFQESVRTEAEAAVKRLRHHPCLALWCGNNEDYSIASTLGSYDASFNGDFTATKFPAREIYERLLPEVCSRLDPERLYWPGSPWGGPDGSSQTVGDRHTWEIWHGPMADYHDYPRYEGRFVSEFGMQGLPDPATVASFTPPEERYIGSRTLVFHNKAPDGFRRLAVYLSDNLPAVSNLEDYIYATQFIQSEALAAAYRGWRRRWGGPGKYAVGGALVWQINDCYPVASWAIVDYELRAKPAYHAIKHELAPLALGLGDPDENGQAALWAVNGTLEKVDARVSVCGWLLSGEQVFETQLNVRLDTNRATPLDNFTFKRDEPVVLGARLEIEGKVVARATRWPEPFKYYGFPDPGLSIEYLEGDKIRLQAQRPAKGVWLSADARVEWSDNMLDLLPGNPQVVEAKGLAGKSVKIRSLADLRIER